MEAPLNTERIDPEELSDLLSEFARTMVTDFPIQSILDYLVKRIVDILPITGAGVTLIIPGRQPEYVAASDPAALFYEQLQTGLGEGPCVLAYDTGKAVSIPDLRTEARFAGFTPPALESGLLAVFTFPMGHEDLLLGALDLYRDEPGPMEEGSMMAAQTLADVVAAYLINAQMRADLQESSARSRDAALHDSLTGLPNRALIVELLEHAFRAGGRSEQISAVFFLDLDCFKEINDTYGHHVGDELLVAVANRLRGLLRPGDSLARLAGDEFVIVCEGFTDRSAADPIAIRLDSEISRPFRLSCGAVTVTASIGIAFTDEGVESAEDLLREADLAMYQSKRSRRAGRGAVRQHNRESSGRQDHLAQILPEAIARGELHLHYQPIVDAEGRIISIEALSRWTDRTGWPIPPGVFIPFAEQSGHGVALGDWTLARVCLDRNSWDWGGVTTAVNVSAHQFMAGGFTDAVREILADAAIDPASVILEVTEGVFASDESRALVVFGELKDSGVNLTLDDFGAGYSPLGYLNVLPIDTIKLDRRFVTDLGQVRGTEKIVAALIGLAHDVGMTVVCNGVETADQWDQLRRLGADGCQGFYFGAPVPATDIDRLIADGGCGSGAPEG